MEGVKDKYLIAGKNEKGENLIERGMTKRLHVGNAYFNKKDIQKFTKIYIMILINKEVKDKGECGGGARITPD